MNKINKIYIGVMGTIGSGKTTLAKELSSVMNLNFYREKVDNNRYLKSFYLNMKKYSFQTEINMLYNRWIQQENILASDKGSIQDRTIYEDMAFAKLLHNSNLMTSDDFKTYTELYEKVISTMSYPDIIIYLNISVQTSMRRIGKRGRQMEESISEDYLKDLKKEYNLLYESLRYKTPIIEVDWNKDSNDMIKDAKNLSEKIKKAINDGFYKRIKIN